MSELKKAADPFLRVMRLQAPLDIPDDKPLRDVLPQWPQWGEFKRLMKAIEEKP